MNILSMPKSWIETMARYAQSRFGLTDAIVDRECLVEESRVDGRFKLDGYDSIALQLVSELRVLQR